MAYKEVTKHREELCKFRVILCPGSKCEQLMPLSSFDEHAKTCSHISLRASQSQVFKLDRKRYDDGNISWNTQIFHLKKETFALRVSMRNSNFNFETMMLAERGKCNRFMTTISIRDPKSATFFNGQFNPSPIGPTNTEESTFTVHKKSLAKIFTINEQDKCEFTIDFKVSEKRALNS